MLLGHEHSDLVKTMLVSLCAADVVFHSSGGLHNDNQIWQQIDVKTYFKIRILSVGFHHPPAQLLSVSVGG